MNWTDRQALHKQLQSLWDKGQLLRSRLQPEPMFPLRLRLKKPTRRELSEKFDDVRQWIDELQQLSAIRIESVSIRHRLLGQNDIPDSAWVDRLEDACRLLHKLPELERFEDMIDTTRIRHPQLLPWLQKHPLRALEQATVWPRLLDIIDWIQQHPRPAIYLRQVDLPAIDSKFIEQQRALLIPLLDLSLPPSAIDTRYNGVRHFALRYGFRDKPSLQRLRLLDARLQRVSGQDQDFALTKSGFDALNENGWVDDNIQRVFITENETNYLAFPRCANALLLFGAGYGFDHLKNCEWLARQRIVYWGDLDTHGFAILDQLRAIHPQVESLLMDQQTLLAHREFWGREEKPQRRELVHLTATEQQLYQDLIHHTWADQLRLEQERIGYRYLQQALQQ